MNSSTQQRLSKALELWTEIANVNPQAESFKMSEYELIKSFNEIQEAIDLDKTGVTATFLLRNLIHDFLDKRSFTLKQIVEDPKGVQEALAKPQQLLELLNHPETQEQGQIFIDGLKQALERYKAADREDIQETLEDEDLIAILRRDALKSMTKLRVHQFLCGAHESPQIQPTYNEMVHQWWNINSLLSASVQMPSGVSMNLIRDPDAFQSYFCFAIRNGANLFVLTDIEELAHPLQGGMRRRPDRVLEDRAQRNWFPYQLLDMKYDEESKRMYETASRERGIVQHQTVFRPLERIENLEAKTLIWTAMMFDLIVDKFWHQKFQCPELSYTGEMIKTQSALLENAKQANLPATMQPPLEMPELAVRDLHTEHVDTEAVGRQETNENFWLEKKFRDQVKAESLNLLAPPDGLFLLNTSTGDVTKTTPEELKEQERTNWALRESPKTLSMAHFNATQFGPQKSLERDRIYIARHNFASQINELAKNDFAARKNEVLSWYLKRVKGNMSAILQWCGHEEIWSDAGISETFDSWRGNTSKTRLYDVEGQDDDFGRRKRKSFHAFLYTMDLKAHYTERLSVLSASRLSPTGPKQELLCQITGAKASFAKILAPIKAEEVALLCNCAVEDLPLELQHWDLRDTYKGNSILDRIDPMEWVVKNPWHKLDLRILLCVSKRGIKQLAANASAPQLDWLKPGKLS